MRTSVTSTRSKIKVKVTELPKLQKVHFSRSISSAVFVWSSKLMVGGDSMGPGLQLVRARFLKSPRKAITRVQTSPYVHRIVSFGQVSSLLWTHTLRPFYRRPIALTQDRRSLVNDVCEYLRD